MITPIISIARGVSLCLFDAEIRKNAIKPWTYATLAWLCGMLFIYYCHAPLLSRVVDKGEGFWDMLIWYLAWMAVGFGLLLSIALFGLIVVMIAAGPFNSRIALIVLEREKLKCIEPETKLSALPLELTQIAITEFGKLIWLIPLGAIALIMGFIPLLTPFAFALSSWLIAYEHADFVLDSLRIPFKKRIWIFLDYALSLIVQGAVLLFLWPFAGFFLPPIIVAGSAWMMSQNEWRKRIIKDSCLQIEEL